nr:MAG TPA: hypothetical protein [Caudoviricetes sp.]
MRFFSYLISICSSPFFLEDASFFLSKIDLICTLFITHFSFKSFGIHLLKTVSSFGILNAYKSV